MSRQDPNFRTEFSNKFLTPHDSRLYRNYETGGPAQNDDISYGASHVQNFSNRYNGGDSRDPDKAHASSEQMHKEQQRFKQNGGAFNPLSKHDNHHQQMAQRGHVNSIQHNSSYLAGGDGNTQGVLSKHPNHHQQMPQRGHVNRIHHNSSYLDGGDGNTRGVTNQKIANAVYAKEVRSNYIQQVRQEQTQNVVASNSKRSNSSSRFSSSSKETAIERSMGKKGRELLHLTMSKANLIQTVNDGISHLQQKPHSSNQKPADVCGQNLNDTFNCESELSNACSSLSAEVINNKLIHPMVKKFRRLYLHNIKEEVDILQELEGLPHRLNEICKKLEHKE